MQTITQIKKNNKYLKNEQVHDLFFDIANGSILPHLVESLWDEPLEKQWNKTPSYYGEKRANIQLSLDFLSQKKGLKTKLKKLYHS